MDSQRWLLAVCLYMASVVSVSETVTTAESQKYTCRTFGSGVFQPFNGSSFYVRSDCPFTFIHFTYNRVECDITIQRGKNGFLTLVEIIINKVKTVLHDGSIMVEKNDRISLPYDQTYQHIFHYGIYTRLKSSLLPLSVTWNNVSGGIDRLWVDLEQELSPDLTGLCAKQDSERKQQLISDNVLSQDTCQTRDVFPASNLLCREFFSQAVDCLTNKIIHYIKLCEKNVYGFQDSSDISCAFFQEVVLMCGKSSHIWNVWRILTNCAPPTCPGDLLYVDVGPAFIPSCSYPNPRCPSLGDTSSCVCPTGEVLNDHADGYQCVNMSTCPCVFRNETYLPRDVRDSSCQSCLCEDGRWNCSENYCSNRCMIEGQFVTTYDGKQYTIPGKCTYMASQGPDWSIKIEFFDKEASIKIVTLQVLQEIFTFMQNTVKLGDHEIDVLHQSDVTLVFWQSSMFVQVVTSFGLKIQVQVFPDIQLYITPPTAGADKLSGLCGNKNGDTTDDFTTSSGIIENSAKLFALSWSLGSCSENIPKPCISTDNEIFADEKCSALSNPTGIFAKCHYVPTDQYLQECFSRTCNCGNDMMKCFCASLGSYSKACASLGVVIGDWRTTTNCTVKCLKNQEFSYETQNYNRTCHYLSTFETLPKLEDMPVEGCGCPEGTYLNYGKICTPKSQCVCYHSGGIAPPGPVVISGQQCLCEDGKLRCSKDCGCRNGKICVQCSEYQMNTAQKTCDSFGKTLESNMTCDSGCYCPEDEYEDHYGECVPRQKCTCAYSGKVFRAGESVKTNCKTCTCNQGQWNCKDEPCEGKCQVYGNGHYQTFDSKWYRFDGHCQYTLVEDYCGNPVGTISVRVENVPCCDEALTCSRSIVLDLEDKLSLTLSDMKVTRLVLDGWTVEADLLYTTHTVGLYIVISVPSKGLTLIWDKHTRLTVELQPNWRNKVCGLCGNFDSNEMNDIQISGSPVASPLAFGNSWKSVTPPCSDVTTEMFPCERNSYCAAWAQRRCMILTGDTFKDCHLSVDPEPYYQACVQESCSCEFEGKFLGFCTAVAAYAEACSEQDVCISWRTPDLCPVYCDYYNKKGECTWHYEACGQMLTCGRINYFHKKLEGCYPRCPEETPYYDESAGRCTELRNCYCYYNDTIVPPGGKVFIHSVCTCENGTFICIPESPSSTTAATTTYAPTTSTLATTIPITTTPYPSTTTATTPLTSTTMAIEFTTEVTTSPTVPTTTSYSSTVFTTATTKPTSTTSTEFTTEVSTESYPTSTTPTIITNSATTSPLVTSRVLVPTTAISTTEQTMSTTAKVTTLSETSATTQYSTTAVTPCVCIDLMKQKSWSCGETWTEDCFQQSCVNGKIYLTPVICSETVAPICPRNQVVKVRSGCCETWACNCRCELYGDPHYISFQGVPFDFLDDCTYILVEERTPRYHFTIAVDTFYCVAGLLGSCTRGIFLTYQNSTASLRVNTHTYAVEATFNNNPIQPPFEKGGLRFQTTGYEVFIYFPEIRSYVSLSAFYTLVVNLAMENFFNNTQGQCGVCGGASCIRRGGQIEDNTCCGKTAYDWLYDDPSKPACFSAPRNVSCHPPPTPVPTATSSPSPPCSPSPLCNLLNHLVFATCRKVVDMVIKKKNCEFDSCTTQNASCSSLSQAAEECKNAGFCVDWRGLTNGICDVECPEGLVFHECRNQLDDFCYGGIRHPGSDLTKSSSGCFCPSGLVRAGTYSNTCVKECTFCKGPLGEPKLPGDVWESDCHICTCNVQTLTEECIPKPRFPTPVCAPETVLVNTTCCGDPVCVEKTCTYKGKTYKVGDKWKDATKPCTSFRCTTEGLQTERRVCPIESCPKEGQIWDDDHCCFACNQTCTPRMATVNLTIEKCSTVLNISVCDGLCFSSPRFRFSSDISVEQDCRCCQQRSSEKRVVYLNCLDLITRKYTYNHITSCECRPCSLGGIQTR
ncbi:mucin-6 isoform X2 [Nothobranchius furzeri]|uniref:mucin-6 isoform X2 n=1 Tax=Nothobranchius furzeri TaxID=105023 RepID=UPI003904CC65